MGDLTLAFTLPDGREFYRNATGRLGMKSYWDGMDNYRRAQLQESWR